MRYADRDSLDEGDASSCYGSELEEEGTMDHMINAEQEEEEEELELPPEVRYIGPLSEAERLRKVTNYLKKKYEKLFSKKHVYTCRKQVAEARLRIKGRFVTKEQAFKILGLTFDELMDNAKI